MGPHNEQSQEKAEQEEEVTFAWDEASVLL